MNKNSVPNDPQSPFVTSGLRIGSPAITTRGFKEAESTELAGWMCDILDDLCSMDEADRTIENMQNLDSVVQVKQKVLDLCKRFPVYA